MNHANVIGAGLMIKPRPRRGHNCGSSSLDALSMDSFVQHVFRRNTLLYGNVNLQSAARPMNRQEREDRADMRHEIWVRSRKAGEYLDQFTAVATEPPEVTLARLPRCLQNHHKAKGVEQ